LELADSSQHSNRTSTSIQWREFLNKLRNRWLVTKDCCVQLVNSDCNTQSVSGTERPHSFRCVRKITKSNYYFRYVCLSVHPSVRLPAYNSAPTERIYMKFEYMFFFFKSVEKMYGSLKSHKNSRYLTRRPIYTSHHITLSVSQNEKCFRQKLYRTLQHILFPKTPFPP